MNRSDKHSYLPIIDLHCDLLGCIEYGQGKYNFDSPELNCSLPQLSAGNVKLQVLAVAAITGKDSSLTGKNQINLYKKLLKTRSDEVGPFQQFISNSKKIYFLLGIENASTLLDEHENLEILFERIERYQALEKILYVSLTWNQENRFGGGNLSSTGLKDDGKVLLQYLDRKNIAIDFSHTSDALACDILDFVQNKSLDIPLIASHSNYRSVCNDKRNLPTDIAKEIIRQNGIIGLNFVHRFVGKKPETFIDHIKHAVSIGGENSISLGADFYGGLNVSAELCPGKTPITFFSKYANSGSYQVWLDLLKKEFSGDFIKKICYQNAKNFLNRVFSNQHSWTPTLKMLQNL